MNVVYEHGCYPNKRSQYEDCSSLLDYKVDKISRPFGEQT